MKKDGTPYKVFTPYFRKARSVDGEAPREPIPMPEGIVFAEGSFGEEGIDSLGLLPEVRWDQSLVGSWAFGEVAARAQLDEFISNRVYEYKKGRDFPAAEKTSRLSPHLHWGTISPHQVWDALGDCLDDDNVDTFRSELGWREFSYSLLYHFQELPACNLQAKFDAFPWQNDFVSLERWQQGRTGYPIVDAGMRELWQTGTMHNRVRMIVGSFLVKNLLLHWQLGAEWFWDCLFDADLASNSASWQWVAGCGADAAPYFRVFNPVTQGEKFDRAGEYTRKYVPELDKLPQKYLYCPWDAPGEVLREAGVVLGETYPKPIVHLKDSRERALEAYQTIRVTG